MQPIRRLILVTLVLAALIAVSWASSGAAAQGVNPARLPQTSDENCAVTAFDITGQGNAYIQGTGGTALPPGIRANQVILPDNAGLQIVKTLGNQDVAILVVDDFFAYQGEVAHGRLVTDLLVAMIRANPTYSAAPVQVSDDPVIWSWEPASAGRLLVVEVDTEDYQTQGLRDRVEAAVDLVNQEYGVNRVVLNMSFVLVPCVTEDYDLVQLRENRVSGDNLHRPLLSEIAENRGLPVNLQRSPAQVATAGLSTDPATRDTVNVMMEYASLAVSRTLSDDTSLDPLHEYLKQAIGEGQYWNAGSAPMVFAVGSAGNFGRALDSLVPGAWPEVASVSANMGLDKRWPSSNRGQVILPGGFFKLGNGYLIGTSFSAPVLSMNMAFYLTQDTLCATPPLTLNLAAFTDPPLSNVVNAGCNPLFR